MSTANETPLDNQDTTPKKADVDTESDVEDVYHQLPPLPSPSPTAHAQYVHCMPPEAPTYRDFSVFLAGSIEMGAAVQWQKHLALLLSPLPITVNNPRRGCWDPAATQEAKNVAFRHQVEWELGALEKADVVCFFFDVNTKSPVTMLELGLWAHSGKVVVCCDKRFWRSGNVHIVCERYNIPYVETFAELAPAITQKLGEKGMELDSNGDLIESGGNMHGSICEWYNNPYAKMLAELVPAITQMLGEKGMKLDSNGDLNEPGGNMEASVSGTLFRTWRRLVETLAELVPAITQMLGEKGMKLDSNGDLIESGGNVEAS